MKNNREKTIIKVKTNVAGTLNVKVSSTEKSFNVNANELTSLDLGILDAGVQNIEISLNAGNNYISAYNSTKLTIYPKMVCNIFTNRLGIITSYKGKISILIFFQSFV